MAGQAPEVVISYCGYFLNSNIVVPTPKLAELHNSC